MFEPLAFASVPAFALNRASLVPKEPETYYFDIPLDAAVLFRAVGRADTYCDAGYYFQAYRILSYTPAGAWIDLGGSGKRFVNLRAVKQWACATKAEALYCLKRRTQRRVVILSNQLAAAEAILEALS